MIFEWKNGLRYNAGIHDWIEEDGSLARAERVADAWGETVEEVEAHRRDRQAREDEQKGRQKWAN